MSIPDNYDQFAAREARQDAWLRSRPVCDHCGRPIQDERLWEIDGETYHADCAEEMFCRDTEEFAQ